MEQRNYGGCKSKIICSGYARCQTHRAGGRSSPPHDQDTRDSNRERSAGKKTVTMAPTSRIMTGRSSYIVRKPLITAGQQVSILKNTLTPESLESVHVTNISNQKERKEINCAQSGQCINKVSSNFQITDSFPSLSREECSGSLSISDLRLSSSYEDHNFVSVPLPKKCDRQSPSSPLLNDLNLTLSLSPIYTSTQQTHKYSFQSSLSEKTKLKALLQETDFFLDKISSKRYNKSHSSEPKHLYPYQANYWACAIPSSLPPSPDRTSPSWDPDKEYQALLDYTYPLRPNMTHTWSSNEGQSGPDGHFPDSGIELDSFLSSSSLSCIDDPKNGSGNIRAWEGAAKRLSEIPDRSHDKPSKFRQSSSPYSSLDQVGFSMESLDPEEKHNAHYRKCGIFSTHRLPAFIRSTCILPHPRSLGDLDEEFLRLPEQLQELQDLSQQLQSLTVLISQPDYMKRDSAFGVQLEQQVLDDCYKWENKNHSSSVNSPHNKGMSEMDEGLHAQEISSKKTRSFVVEVKSSMDHIKGTSLSELQRRTGVKEVEDETAESVQQNLQAFCSNLEKLIWWLYKVVKQIECLSSQSLDIESVKSSLTKYESFQKDIQAHRSLTASVLQTGERLLCCMNSASPFLKETLMLIEQQSHQLEVHSEHLFSSILSAMDSLTQAKPTADDTAFPTERRCL